MIRVLLAEDQAMVRDALATLLGLQPDIEVVAAVSRGDEVIGAAMAAQPDVALLDIEMPGLTGLEAAALLRDRLPACKVLILTTFGRPGYLRRAMASGVVGFLVKEAPAAQLAVAIRRAVAGERIVDPALATAALSRAIAPSQTVSARYWRRHRVARGSPRLPPRSHSPRARYATISPRPSRNWGHAIAARPRALPSSRGGCRLALYLSGIERRAQWASG